MIRSKLIIFVIIFLISGTVLAATNSAEQVWTIKLESGDPGDSLTLTNTNPPKWMYEKISLVNEGRGELFIEVYNDPTSWQFIKWLEKQSDTAVINSDWANKALDGGNNNQCLANSIRLLEEMGLTIPMYRYKPDRGKESLIQVSFIEYPKQRISVTDTLYVSRTDTLRIIESPVAYVIDLDCKIGGGVEFTVLDDCRRFIVPVLSLEVSLQQYMLSLNGGLYPGNELDYKFLAVSLAYFPNDSNLGLVIRGIYNSEAIELGYTKRSFGPAAGFIIKDNKFSLYVTAGIQSFDRFDQESEGKFNLNLGLIFKPLSF